MAARVAHYVVLQVDYIVLDIALETEEKARLHIDAVLINLLGGRLVSRPHCIDLLSCGSCLHHVSFS